MCSSSSGVSCFPFYLVAKLHLNHRKASPCVLNFSFFLSSFHYRSSSWRPYMVVHQGFYSFFNCSSSFLDYIVAMLHLNHRKALPCVLNFSFFLSSFYYRSSSWRLYMMVHQGFNLFSKCSLGFLLEELKYSSSCIPKCNSFYDIF